MFKLVQFDTGFKVYSTPGAISRDENTLGHHIVNTGDCIAYINNFPLYPSGVLDTMYPGYVDKSTYNIRFDIGGANPEVTVISFNQRKV